MPKATRSTSAKKANEKAKKAKKPAPAATAKRAAAKKPAQKKPARLQKPSIAKKVAAKKPAAKKPTVTKKVARNLPATKAPAKWVPPQESPAEAAPPTLRTRKTVRARAPKSVAHRAVEPATKQPTPVRVRRRHASVLEVSAEVIDTSSAAEVAARLVVDGHGAPSEHALGNIFTPPPAVGLKRGSSALRHVKEALHKPVAAQLEGVFGPAPVPPETMARFLKGGKTARTQRVKGSTNFHSGQPTVGHRSVG
jgi:hypothetical protein